jgi:hypothetical protein
MWKGKREGKKEEEESTTIVTVNVWVCEMAPEAGRQSRWLLFLVLLHLLEQQPLLKPVTMHMAHQKEPCGPAEPTLLFPVFLVGLVTSSRN